MFITSTTKYYKKLLKKNIAGSFSFTTSKAGAFQVILVGGGAGSGAFDAKYYGGWSHWTFACGGSGACFNGIISLEANKTYTVTVGGGGTATKPNGISGAGGDTFISSDGNIIISAGGGGGAQCAAYLGAAYTGQGGKLFLGNSVVEIYSAINGNNGPYGVNTTYQYARSVLDNTDGGYGASGYGWADGDDHAGAGAGVVGYAEIIALHNSIPANASSFDYSLKELNVFIPCIKKNNIFQPFPLIKQIL